MVPLPAVIYVLLTAIAAVCGIFDFRYRRIPNWITLPAIAAGVLFHAMRMEDGGVLFALYGMAAALAVYLPLYMLRGMGAGDVKLMAAIGALVGPTNWVFVFLGTALIGGAAALAMVAMRGRFYETWFNVSALVADLAHFRAPYRNSSALDVRNPYSLRLAHGVSIAGGACAFVIFSLQKSW